jgi:hypothetical protein
MFIDGEVPEVLNGAGYVECHFEPFPFRPRVYELWGGVRTGTGVGELVEWQRLGVFRLAGSTEAAGKGFDHLRVDAANLGVAILGAKDNARVAGVGDVVGIWTMPGGNMVILRVLQVLPWPDTLVPYAVDVD